jgi:hypothetical protein
MALIRGPKTRMVFSTKAFAGQASMSSAFVILADSSEIERGLSPLKVRQHI